MLNVEQVKGIVERLLTILATYAVAKGWVSSGNATEIITLCVALAGAAWGWHVNRTTELAKATINVAVPGTMVLTDRETAAATPTHPDIKNKDDVTVQLRRAA